MENTEQKVLFSTTGQKGSDMLALGAALFIISIALLFYSLITRGEVIGPWYLYTAAIILLLIFLVVSKKRNKVHVELLSGDEPVITVKGTSASEHFKVAQFSCWYFMDNTSRTSTHTILHLAVVSPEDEGIGFLGTRAYNESLGSWQEVAKEIPKDLDRYTLENLGGLVRALDENFSERRVDTDGLPF